MSIKHHNYSLILEFDRNYNDDKQYAINAIKLISETKHKDDLTELQKQRLVPFGYVYRCIQSDDRTYIGKRVIQAHKQWGYYLGSSRYLDYDRIIRKELIAFAYDNKSLAELEMQYIQNEITNANNRGDVINKRVKVHDSWGDERNMHKDALIENIGIGLLSDLYLGLGSAYKIHEYLYHAGRICGISTAGNCSNDSISTRAIRDALHNHGIMKMQTIMRTYKSIINNNNNDVSIACHNHCIACNHEFISDDGIFCSNACACAYYIASVNDDDMREYILSEYDITELGYSSNTMRTIWKHYGLVKNNGTCEPNMNEKNRAIMVTCVECGAEFKSKSGNANKFCSKQCAYSNHRSLGNDDIMMISNMIDSGRSMAYIADYYNISIVNASDFIKRNSITITSDAIISHQRTGAYNAHLRWHEHRNIIKDDCIYCMNDNELLKPLKYQSHVCLNPLCSHMIATSFKKHTCSQKCGFIYGRIVHYYNNHKKKHVNINNSDVHKDVITYCWFCNHHEFNDDCIAIKDMVESAYHGLINMHALLCEHFHELHENGMSRNRIALDYGISRSMVTDLLNGRKLF